MSDADRNRVLFVCIGNTCRSQLAAAILNHQLADRWVAVSGGIRTPRERDPRTKLVLEEMGINAEIPAAKHIEHYRGKAFDLIITLDDQVREPIAQSFPATRTVHQHIDDPFRDADAEQSDLSRHQQARDEIIEKLTPILECQK